MSAHSIVGEDYETHQQIILVPDSSQVGIAGTGMFRYNASTGNIQISNNGSAWATVGTGAALTLLSGTNINIVTVGSNTTVNTVSGPNFSGTTTLAANQLVINNAYDGTTATLRAPTTNSVVIGNASSDTVIQGSSVSCNVLGPVAPGILTINRPVIGSTGEAVAGGIRCQSNFFQTHNGVDWSTPSTLVLFNTSDPNGVSTSFNPNRPLDFSCVYVSSVDYRFWVYTAGLYRSITQLSVSTPNVSGNANGLSLTSGVLTLAPASASFPGIVTTGSQTLAGDKTFSGATTISTLTAGRVPFAGTGGLLSDSSLLTYSAGLLSTTAGLLSDGVLTTSTTPLRALGTAVGIGNSVLSVLGRSDSVANNGVEQRFNYLASGSTGNSYALRAVGETFNCSEQYFSGSSITSGRQNFLVRQMNYITDVSNNYRASVHRINGTTGVIENYGIDSTPFTTTLEYDWQIKWTGSASYRKVLTVSGLNGVGVHDDAFLTASDVRVTTIQPRSGTMLKFRGNTATTTDLIDFVFQNNSVGTTGYQISPVGSSDEVYIRSSTKTSDVFHQFWASGTTATTALTFGSTGLIADNMIIGTTGAAQTGGLRMNGTALEYYASSAWNTLSSAAISKSYSVKLFIGSTGSAISFGVLASSTGITVSDIVGGYMRFTLPVGAPSVSENGCSYCINTQDNLITGRPVYNFSVFAANSFDMHMVIDGSDVSMITSIPTGSTITMTVTFNPVS